MRYAAIWLTTTKAYSLWFSKMNGFQRLMLIYFGHGIEPKFKDYSGTLIAIHDPINIAKSYKIVSPGVLNSGYRR